jgi:hypothetical protein
MAEILNDPQRRWLRRPGAAEADVQRVLDAARVPLPEALAETLRLSNGGEAPLSRGSQLFVLDGVAEMLESLSDPFLTQECSGLVFFGGDGARERFAIDTRDGLPPWPIVMVDPIAGPDSARRIAASFEDFMAVVGISSPS